MITGAGVSRECSGGTATRNCLATPSIASAPGVIDPGGYGLAGLVVVDVVGTVVGGVEVLVVAGTVVTGTVVVVTVDGVACSSLQAVLNSRIAAVASARRLIPERLPVSFAQTSLIASVVADSERGLDVLAM